MFSNLPSCGKPTRIIIYDLHTLQNRFYLHGNSIASLQTCIPLVIKEIQNNTIDGKHQINCIAFPDDGAAKRFSYMFKDYNYEIVTCGKTRKGDERIVNIQEGDAKDKHVLIIDDLVQTGGTLYECGLALKKNGAKTVSVFVSHCVFPKDAWKRFCKNPKNGHGDRNDVFEKFFTTNSNHFVAKKLPTDDIYVIIDISDKIVEDLDSYS